MTIGISTQTYPEWVDEFKNAATVLGMPYVLLDTRSSDWLRQGEETGALVWRVQLGDPAGLDEARAKLPILERAGKKCFPNSLMLWLYDDKVRQTYLLQSLGVKTPKTFVSSDESEIRKYLDGAAFPLVAKTPHGASSSGVLLLRSQSEALRYVSRAFRFLHPSPWQKVLRRSTMVLGGKRIQNPEGPSRSAKVYLQEYVKSDFDWRVTTLGRDLVSVFKRHNRPNDFRASGSGLWEHIDERNVPHEACEIALDLSRRCGFTSMAYDFLERDGQYLLVEMSYTFLLNRVYTDSLFRHIGTAWKKQPPEPIGVLHLRALIDSDGGKSRIWM